MVKLGKAMQCHFNREPSAVEISTFSRDKSRCTSELHWGRFFFNDFVSRLPTLQNRCPHSPFLLSPSPQWSVYSLLNPVDVFTVFNHHHVTHVITISMPTSHHPLVQPTLRPFVSSPGDAEVMELLDALHDLPRNGLHGLVVHETRRLQTFKKS